MISREILTVDHGDYKHNVVAYAHKTSHIVQNFLKHQKRKFQGNLLTKYDSGRKDI